MKRTRPTQSEYLKLLLYGQPGSTKTRTAGSAALDERTSRVLWLDIGGNPLSIRDYAQQPDILEIEKLTDLNPVYNWLNGGQKPEAPIVKQYDLQPPYKTVVVDGVTDLQRFSFAAVTGNTAAGPGDHGSRIEQQHYGSVLAQMTTMARLFFKLPMHVIITALERDTVDRATDTVIYRPLLLGQSATEVAGYAYAVIRLMHVSRLGAKQKREGEVNTDTTSIALFKPTANMVAKDQYGTLGESMTDPTITKIYNRIYGE